MPTTTGITPQPVRAAGSMIRTATAATAERRQATCHPVRLVALIAAPPEENRTAAPKMASRARSPPSFSFMHRTLADRGSGTVSGTETVPDPVPPWCNGRPDPVSSLNESGASGLRRHPPDAPWNRKPHAFGAPESDRLDRRLPSVGQARMVQPVRLREGSRGVVHDPRAGEAEPPLGDARRRRADLGEHRPLARV